MKVKIYKTIKSIHVYILKAYDYFLNKIRTPNIKTHINIEILHTQKSITKVIFKNTISFLFNFLLEH